MFKPLKYLFTLGVPLALIGVGAAWMLQPSFAPETAAVYDTVDVTRGPIRKIVSTSGPVRALVTVSVGSQLSGLIDKLNVDYNSEVKEGDVLATIDARTFSARVAQARADLAAAKAGLVNQEAALKRGDAIRIQAEKASERQSSLQKKGYAATATLDTAQRDLALAIADIEVAKAQIASARAVIEQREASLKQAEVDLERTFIRAPINGTVISRTIDVGQTVAASLQAPELFKIAQDLRRIRIEAQVNEADVGAVTDGNDVSFTVDAYPDRTFQGKVTQVRLAATELQNVVTYTVIIEATNDDRKLFPGMTANVQIEVARNETALRVPNDALRFKPRNDVASSPSDRSQRMLTRLKDELQLTDEQQQALKTEIAKMVGERASAPGGTQSDVVDPAAMRQRMQSAIERTLAPLLSEAQRPLFDKWKHGRETTKAGGLFVLDDKG
ncbi:MAG: efflux RND transporter periplasmic adaptor subunit, partial [Hyphomicrobium sp.]